MSYRVAGIDVHKRMLAVVITDVEVDAAGCNDMTADKRDAMCGTQS